MSYLQLAENDPYNRLAEGNPLNNYIFIPAGMLGMQTDTYVREDFFDGLSADEYQKTITMLAPYQNQGLSAIGAIAGIGLNVAKRLIQKRQERVAAGTAKPLFKAGGKLSNLVGKLKGMKAQAATDQNAMPAPTEKNQPFDVQASGNIGGTEFNVTAGEEKESFIKKYKTPLLIGGGLLLVGGAFLLLRKKRRR
jgi:LPXTG-motif cell wall-anchored protein